MSWRQKPKRAANRLRTDRTSATTGSGSIKDLHQFPRCANHPGLKIPFTANGFDPGSEGRIGDLSTIPGQETIDSVDGCHRDMQGVGGCLWRPRHSFEQRCGKRFLIICPSNRGKSAKVRSRSVAAFGSPAEHSLMTNREMKTEILWRWPVHHSCVVSLFAAIRRMLLGCMVRLPMIVVSR